jgi:hypothetical protein
MTFSCRSYIDALSANVQRVYSKTPEVPQKTMADFVFSFHLFCHTGLSRKGSYLPAAHAKEESHHIGLLLLVKLLDIFEGTHLLEVSDCNRSLSMNRTLTVVVVPVD